MVRGGFFHSGLVGLVAVLVFILGQSAAHAVILDAHCPGPSNSSLPLNGDEREAQSFRIAHAGTLVSAQTEIDKTNPGGDFQLQILAAGAFGFPTNAILGAVTISDASLPTGPVTLVGNFNPPVSVQRFGRYALAVTRPGGNPYELRDRSGPGCLNGSEFFSPSQTDPFVNDDPGFDFVFQTFVQPSNQFTIIGVDPQLRNLRLRIPNPGAVAVADAGTRRRTATAAARKPLLKPAQNAVIHSGSAWVRLRLTRTGKRIFKKHGKVILTAAVTFTPDGGDPNTLIRKLKLNRPKSKPSSP